MSSTGSTTTDVMEQAKYWMWMRRKLTMSEKPAYVDRHYNFSTTTTTSTTTSLKDEYTSNWEEQAFAEDSAGPLGGFIWPPRSYSCNFCGREFRSAQALGGHMNVHRRDRARLKESSTSPTSPTSTSPENENRLRHRHDQKPHMSDEVCKVVCNSSHSFVSLPFSTPKICDEDEKLVSSSRSRSCFSTIVHDEEKQKGSHLSLDLPCSDSAAVRVLSSTHVSHSKLKNSKAHEIGLVQDVKSGSAVNLYSSLDKPKWLDTNHEEAYMSSKRRRQDHHVSLLSCPLKPGLVVDQCRHFHKVSAGLIPSSMEELDLELRLGDRPKVT